MTHVSFTCHSSGLIYDTLVESTLLDGMFLKSEVLFSELVPDFRFCFTVVHVWKASDILDCMKIIGIQELCGLGATGYKEGTKR